ncbi:hypothetical protein L1987_06767 [Smallanthus sonchifolius]|uniref:Uncharacterized protein n=1 Tax=Smallanthus sonchifolius TaxID=185202 RepID=A0ACB9JZ07_9ASTR|nr:hypothetical protein L1987_06767 [Smallanthus sonchifolius]
MSTDELVKLFTARARRRFHRGMKRKTMALIKKLCKAVYNEQQVDKLGANDGGEINAVVKGLKKERGTGGTLNNEDLGAPSFSMGLTQDEPKTGIMYNKDTPYKVLTYMDALLDMSTDELVKLFTARARRRFHRGMKRRPMALIKKLRKALTYMDALLDMSTDELVKLFTARAHRRFHRGMKRKPMALIKKLRKALLNFDIPYCSLVET